MLAAPTVHATPIYRCEKERQIYSWITDKKVGQGMRGAATQYVYIENGEVSSVSSTDY